MKRVLSSPNRSILSTSPTHKTTQTQLGWLEVLRRIFRENMFFSGREFTYKEFFNHIDEISGVSIYDHLKSIFPDNNTIEASVRQKFQILRDKDELIFVKRGVFSSKIHYEDVDFLEFVKKYHEKNRAATETISKPTHQGKLFASPHQFPLKTFIH
jgi:hypothetical protein